MMLRLVLALAIAAHGMGHVLFLIPLLGLADWDQNSQSWLLTGQTLARWVGGALWIVALVGFVIASLGLLTEHGWWRTAVVAASVVSIAGLALFWKTPPNQPVSSALVFNVAVLIALLIAHWPSASAVGS